MSHTWAITPVLESMFHNAIFDSLSNTTYFSVPVMASSGANGGDLLEVPSFAYMLALLLPSISFLFFVVAILAKYFMYFAMVLMARFVFKSCAYFVGGKFREAYLRMNLGLQLLLEAILDVVKYPFVKLVQCLRWMALAPLKMLLACKRLLRMAIKPVLRLARGTRSAFYFFDRNVRHSGRAVWRGSKYIASGCKMCVMYVLCDYRLYAAWQQVVRQPHIAIHHVNKFRVDLREHKDPVTFASCELMPAVLIFCPRNGTVTNMFSYVSLAFTCFSFFFDGFYTGEKEQVEKMDKRLKRVETWLINTADAIIVADEDDTLDELLTACNVVNPFRAKRDSRVLMRAFAALVYLAGNGTMRTVRYVRAHRDEAVLAPLRKKIAEIDAYNSAVQNAIEIGAVPPTGAHTGLGYMAPPPTTEPEFEKKAIPWVKSAVEHLAHKPLLPGVDVPWVCTEKENAGRDHVQSECINHRAAKPCSKCAKVPCECLAADQEKVVNHSLIDKAMSALGLSPPVCEQCGSVNCPLVNCTIHAGACLGAKVDHAAIAKKTVTFSTDTYKEKEVEVSDEFMQKFIAAFKTVGSTGNSVAAKLDLPAKYGNVSLLSQDTKNVLGSLVAEVNDGKRQVDHLAKQLDAIACDPIIDQHAKEIDNLKSDFADMRAVLKKALPKPKPEEPKAALVAESRSEEHKGSGWTTPDWLRGLKDKSGVVDNFLKQARNMGYDTGDFDNDPTVYDDFITMLEDEIDACFAKKQGAYFGYDEWSMKDQRRLKDLLDTAEAVDRVTAGRFKNHAAVAGKHPRVEFYRLLAKIDENPALKTKSQLSKWMRSAKSSGLDQKYITKYTKIFNNYQTGMLTKDIEELVRAKDHAIVVPSVQSGARDLKKFDTIGDYNLCYDGREGKVYTRGIRTKLPVAHFPGVALGSTDAKHLNGIVTAQHLLPPKMADFVLEKLSWSADGGTTWVSASNKHTQCAFSNEKNCQNCISPNCAIKGCDCFFIMDDRLNKGKLAAVGKLLPNIPLEYPFYTKMEDGSRKCTIVSVGCVQDTSNDLTVCKNLRYVSASTDVNEGASGAPFFQFQNGQLVLVALNKGLDKKRPEFSLVQEIQPLNFWFPQGSTGSGQGSNTPTPPSQPGAQE